MTKFFIVLSIFALIINSKIAAKQYNKNRKKQLYCLTHKKVQVTANPLIQKVENGEIHYKSPRRKGGNYDIFPNISVVKAFLKD